MNLNDVNSFGWLDTQGMLCRIDGLPDQLRTAWELGTQQDLPSWNRIRNVLIAGMGGSAIGADLLAAYLAPHSPVPIIIHRNYGLPAWARGPDTLVIASSHSGDTEETLDAVNNALAHNCRLVAITTGGNLAQTAADKDILLWKFVHEGQPRAAVGFSFGLLLSLLTRLGLAPNLEGEIRDAINAMQSQQANLTANIPDVNNPAKRQAGQLIGRSVSVFGSDFLVPVARRWKGQINELAKAWGQFEDLPEADHNLLAGSMNPEHLLSQTAVIFLRAAFEHPRNRLRSDLTRKSFMLNGIPTDFIDAQGKTRLAQMWTALHFGDYTAYYLAMAYGMDPSPVDAIENFKRELNSPQ